MKYPYRAGANFERRVRRHLEDNGWVVFRSAGSKSPADLIALKAGEVLLVQVQIDKYLSDTKKGALQLLGQELRVAIAFAWREGKELKMAVL